MLEVLASGITLINSAKAGFDWMVGHSYHQKLDLISTRLERIEHNIFYAKQQEVRDCALAEQALLKDRSVMRSAAGPSCALPGRKLLLSQPIATPSRLRERLQRSPEDLLFGIKLLDDLSASGDALRDASLIPVIFAEGRDHYIGFMKAGYAADYLNFEYSPQFNVYISAGLKTTRAVSVMRSGNGTILRSLRSKFPAHIFFQNACSARAVQTFWCDFNGREIFYKELQPGVNYSQQTYSTHPWHIRESRTGEIIGTVMPGAVRQHVLIHD